MPDSPIYVERLTALSLAKALARTRGARPVIRAFDVALSGASAARVLGTLGRRVEIDRIEAPLADARDRGGSGLFMRLIEDVTRLSLTIGHSDFDESSFLAKAESRFTRARLQLFLEKGIALDIERPVALAHLADWHCRAHSEDPGTSEPPLVLLRRRPWTRALAAHFADIGVRIVFYRAPASAFRPIAALAEKVLGRSRRAVPGVDHKTAPPPERPPPVRGRMNGSDGATDRARRPGRAVAHWYTGRTLTFDRARRSEFFWLNESQDLKDRLLVCFEEEPPSEWVETLAGIGVPYAVAHIGRAAHLLPKALARSSRCRSALASGLALALGCALGASLRGERRTGFLTALLARYVVSYVFWLDFFERHPVALNMYEFDLSRLHLPMADALRDLGAVSLTHQWANLRYETIMMANASEVSFCFGPAYERFFEANDSAVGRLVLAGYMTDDVFELVKDRAAAARARLVAAGARFVVCFFDENSSDAPDAVITDQHMVAVHRALLEQVLADPTLGLILKPGFPRTFYDRVAPIRHLIDKARETGRLLIVDSGGGVKTDAYPAETAQAADLCVGLLLSGTAALEAWLAGTPTVFLDYEAILSDPVHEYGRGTLVFGTVEELWDAVDRFRRDPASAAGFGDLSRWAEGKDPFRDGRAPHRMASYAQSLLDALESGRSGAEALSAADAAYKTIWGDDKVVLMDDVRARRHRARPACAPHSPAS